MAMLRLFLDTNLGQPLVEYVKGQQLATTSQVFGISDRQLRNIVYNASEAALGYWAEPKAFRRFYIRTVAEVSAQVLGFAPQHMEVAQKMVGHEHVSISWDWYFELTVDERRRIQEMIPV